MALSVQQDRSGPDWPLGFVKVKASGTPVSLMVNVDPNSVNSPGNATTALSAEYTPVVRAIAIQAMMPNANNSGTLVGAMSDVGQAGLRVGAAGWTGGASEVAIHTAQRMAAPILAKRAQRKATSPTAGVGYLDDVGK